MALLRPATAELESVKSTDISSLEARCLDLRRKRRRSSSVLRNCTY